MSIRRPLARSIAHPSDPRAAEASPDCGVLTKEATTILLELAERLARSVARRWRYEDVDELAQIGLLAALERVSAYQASYGKPFEAFVVRRMRGAMNDHCMRESTLAAQHATTELGDVEDEASSGGADGTAGIEDGEAVMDALGKLDELHRTLVVARVVERVPLTGCARRVGVPYHRARYALAMALEELGEAVRVARARQG